MSVPHRAPVVPAHPVAVVVAERLPRYDQNWSEVVEFIRNRLNEGETCLSRILRQVEANWRRTADLNAANGTALGRRIDMPMAALIGGRQALWRQVLLNNCRDDTALVVELGAGWGNNLVDLYVGGGPRAASYIALEPTASGREAVTLLANLDPDLSLQALAFDYRSPSYGALAGDIPHALVFSSHSIEQVVDLPAQALSGLLGLAKAVTVVHFEPIGWQIREARGEAAAQQGASRAYAEAKNYNRNLWDVLQCLDREGAIAIRSVIPDLFCHKPVNVSSLVVWENNRATTARTQHDLV